MVIRVGRWHISTFMLSLRWLEQYQQHLEGSKEDRTFDNMQLQVRRFRNCTIWTQNLLSQMRFMIAALLAAMTIMADAQRPVCAISPPPNQCRIADNQVCPGGCIRPRNCPGVIAVTSTSVSTTTRFRTTITNTATVTNTSTVTVTPTVSASVITVTVSSSTSSTAPPSCKTEVPYANLFTFPDTKCTNTSNLQPGSSNPFVVHGLIGASYKFSNLTYNATSKYNESSCVTLPDTEGGARSLYFTVDGIPQDTFPSCTMNLYEADQCQGSPARYVRGQANKCNAAPDNIPWRSVQFKCAYTRDLCTDNEIFLGTCIKY
jgi:hypothetical protein